MDQQDRTPDLILTQGKVITADPVFALHEAVAIADGRVVATGATVEIEAMAGPGTRREHLEGRTVLPGLIDAHCHMLATGVLLGQAQLYDCRSIGDILARVTEAVKITPPGQWIVGRGWDESLLAERRFPTRYELDSVSPNHPVCLHRVWNKLVANSRALAMAGIDRSTPDPDPSKAYAGSFDRDIDGEPTGLFRDRAKEMIDRHIPSEAVKDKVAALRRAARTFAGVGGGGRSGLVSRGPACLSRGSRGRHDLPGGARSGRLGLWLRRVGHPGFGLDRLPGRPC
jgi:predicted amidohydrolase YtcJ